MPTTSPELIRQVIGALGEVECRWCVLHRENELLTGKVTSDVDVAADKDPADVVTAMAQRLLSSGVVLVQSWEYDRNERSSVFVASRSLDSVQFDIVNDPDGRGVLGFRSPAFLDNAVPGERWPTLSPVDSVLYRTRKRQVKSDTRALQALAQEREKFPENILVSRVREVFEPWAARRLVRLLRSDTGDTPVGWGKGPGYWVGTQLRRLRRIRRPPGTLVIVATASRVDGREIAERLQANVVDAKFFDIGSARDAATVMVRSRRPTITFVRDSPVARVLSTILPSLHLGDGDPYVKLLRGLHAQAIQNL